MHVKLQGLESWSRQTRASLRASRGWFVRHCSGSAGAWVLRQIRHAGTKHVLVETESSDEFLHVLISNELIGVLGQDRHSQLRRASSALGGRRVSTVEYSFETKAEERQGIVDHFLECFRIALREVGGIGSLWEASNVHAHFVLLLPLVDRRGSVLSRGVGVVGQDDTCGEVLHESKVVFAERRATRGHRSGHAGREERDDVGIALT